ncbi:MAG TPA: zinc transporter ZupT [Candidatus Spyradenecus faecavium]|uniref:Zinc transporter ZupT n=1 Tax=Candidatus Spyradenecus faecavium TaxID=2840947 RepID=A0A9D1NKV8_9BACT|nr:zinc transporter ZupT [Candidatus Spyradenecus faecavium]
MTERFLIALLLTLIAGLSTGLGAAIAFFAPRANTRFLSVCTGLSAGVMLYVSFMEILPEAFAQIMEAGLAETPATALGTLGFFLGIALIFLIDRLVPDAENPHETHPKGDYLALRDPAQAATPAERRAIRKATRQTRRTLLRMGAFTALAITVHNFPEGLSTFLAALVDPHLGAVIAFAIALHNIPEGISVSVPIYYATGNRRRAFVWSCLAGFAEPAGALFLWAVLALCHGALFFEPPPMLMGLVSGAVAGIMVFISLDELLPASRAYGKGHDSLYGLVAGMALMALSLLLL